MIVGHTHLLFDTTMLTAFPDRNPNYMNPFTCNVNSTFDQDSEQQYLASKTGPWTGRPSTAVAFPSFPHIANSTTISALLAAAAQTTTTSLLPIAYSTSPTLQAGYIQQLSSLLTRLALNTTPCYENLNNNAGGLDISLMHPLSRGTVQLTSTDPFTPPAINPNWLTHPLDTSIMLAAMQFNQRILDTPSILALQPAYTGGIPPNASVDTLTSLLQRGAGTEFHYSGTAAMLPLSLGGVVDTNLRVYGTSNLRVVDGSIFPLIPAAHLQAVVYGVAEKAADVIRGINSTADMDNNHGAPSAPFYKWLACSLGITNSTAETN